MTDIYDDPSSGGGASLASIQTELNNRNLTANRLNGIIRRSDGSSGEETSSTGTYNHADGVTEDQVIEFSALRTPVSVTVDLNALTQAATIRTYEKVDGTTYRLLNSAAYPADFPTNVKAVEIVFNRKNRQTKITLQSTITEGAIRAIPYAVKEWFN